MSWYSLLSHTWHCTQESGAGELSGSKYTRTARQPACMLAAWQQRHLQPDAWLPRRLTACHTSISSPLHWLPAKTPD